MTHMSYDWLGFAIKLIIAIGFWLNLRTFYKYKADFKEQLKVVNVISYVRRNRPPIKDILNMDTVPLPEEIQRKMQKATPEYEMFMEQLREEYEIVKKVLQNKLMTYKSSKDINAYLAKYYPFKK